jgi:hypothetical protein
MKTTLWFCWLQILYNDVCTVLLYLAENKFMSTLPVPEIIDPVFAKTSPKRSFSMTEYERFGLVFTKTRVYKFGHRSVVLQN